MRYTVEAGRQLIVDPLKDRVFRRFVLHGVMIAFAVAALGPFVWLMALEAMGFSYLGTNVLFLVVGPCSAFVAVKGWGRLVDRWGCRPVLILSTGMAVFSATPWFLMTRGMQAPEFVVTACNRVSGAVGSLVGHPEWTAMSPGEPWGAYLLAAMGCMFGGVAWTGVEMARTNITLGFADGPGRSKYVASAGGLMSLGGVLGGLSGGFLTYSLKFMNMDHPWVVGPFEWNNWHAAFALSVLARAMALVWAIRLPEDGAGRVRDMLRLFGFNVYNNVRTRLFYGQRLFGWRRRRDARPSDSDDRDPRP